MARLNRRWCVQYMVEVFMPSISLLEWQDIHDEATMLTEKINSSTQDVKVGQYEIQGRNANSQFMRTLRHFPKPMATLF